jgi:SAM-dependent methyltransferase
VAFQELKEQIREGWTAGEYAPISALTRPVAQVVVDETAISAGQEVLDVAAGDGNLSLLAALEGASVTASDLTPAMVERGRARTEAEGVDVRWEVADVEELPFPDDSFECVVSIFGAMFAPRPRVAAEQMFRVLRPGGTLGMTAWTPESFTARMFRVGNRHAALPDGVEPPSSWGVEENVRERLDGLAGTVRCERRTVRWEFPSAEAYLAQLATTGPSTVQRAGQSEEELERFKAELLELIAECDRGDGSSLVLEPEYLLVVARKRG